MKKTMFNFKIFIYFILTLLSLCLCYFLFFSAKLPVNADSENKIPQDLIIEPSDFINTDNSVNLSLSDYYQVVRSSASDCSYTTLIFKFDYVLSPGICFFEIQSKINTLNDNANYGYVDDLSFNVDNIEVIDATYYNTLSPGKDNFIWFLKSFQYVQLILPNNLIDVDFDYVVDYFNLKCICMGGSLAGAFEIGKPVAIIKGTNELFNLDNVSRNFNLPLFNSLTEFNGGRLKYNKISFIGERHVSDGDLIEKYVAYEKNFTYDTETDTVYLDESLDDIYSYAKSSLHPSTYYTGSYGTERRYDFSTWDLNSESIIDFSNDIIVNAVYVEIPKVYYDINFYGYNDDLIYGCEYVKYIDGGELFFSSVYNLSDIWEIATSKAHLKDDYGFSESPYYNRIFKSWNISYNEDLVVNSNLNVYGTWEFEDINYTVNICDENGIVLQELIIPNGTLISDLNLTYEEKEHYSFEHFVVYQIKDGSEYNTNIVNDFSMVRSDCFIKPVYKFTSVRVIFRTATFSEYHKNFEVKDMTSQLVVKKGETVDLPDIISYDNFTAIYWTLENGISKENAKLAYTNRLGDLDLDSVTIPLDYDDINMCVYLLYRYDDISIDNNNNNNNNNDEVNNFYDNKNYNLYVVIGVIFIVIIIAFIVIIKIIKNNRGV